MSKTLYDLTAEYTALYEAMASGDDLTEEQVTALSDLSGDLTAKLDAYGCVMAELKNKADQIKAEEDRLKAWRTTVENHIKRMKQSVEMAMLATGQTKVETPHWRYSVQKSYAVEPSEDFVEWAVEHGREDLYTIKYDVSKTNIKKALQAGEEIPARIIEGQFVKVV